MLVGLASGRRRLERLGLPVEEGNAETVLKVCTRRVMPGCVRLILAEAATIDPVSTTATNASRSWMFIRNPHNHYQFISFVALCKKTINMAINITKNYWRAHVAHPRTNRE